MNSNITKSGKDIRIVFMGTPDFAVASLKALVENGYNVVAVVTAPDKPAGRGMQLQESAVKQYAVTNSLPVLQPEKLRNPDFISQLKNYNAELQIVVAFRMLPEMVWNMPPMGTLNVHGSLLPQYRGAAPINWAVINGDKYTGVSTFLLQHEIDTGNILLQEKLEITEEDTAGTVHDKMMVLGAQTLLKTVDALAGQNITPRPQESFANEETLRHAPKIFTETCKIDWNNSVENIYNFIRGLSPYPAAYSELQSKTFKIFKASKEKAIHEYEIGTYHTDGKNYLKFACIDGFIHILELQIQGKKRLAILDFLRGYRF